MFGTLKYIYELKYRAIASLTASLDEVVLFVRDCCVSGAEV